MFVRTLIGREAGTVIMMPADAAQAVIAAGTAIKVTGEEIVAAGFSTAPAVAQPDPEKFPEGFRAIPSEDGGYDVEDAGGVVLNDRVIPNLAAARCFAHDYVAGQSTTGPATEQEPDLDKMTRAELDALAISRGIDISTAKNKADVIALLKGQPIAAAPKLDDLSDDDLKKLAEERKIDISAAADRAAIIAAIAAAEQSA